MSAALLWCFGKKIRNTNLPTTTQQLKKEPVICYIDFSFPAATMTLVTLRVVREKGSGLATIAKEQADSRTDQHSRALSGLTTGDLFSCSLILGVENHNLFPLSWRQREDATWLEIQAPALGVDLGRSLGFSHRKLPIATIP